MLIITDCICKERIDGEIFMQYEHLRTCHRWCPKLRTSLERAQANFAKMFESTLEDFRKGTDNFGTTNANLT